jgi:hypothetical protein
MRAESLSWLAPAPLWGQGGISLDGPELAQPFLAELTSDQFVTEFLTVMGAQGGASPAQLGTMAPAVTSDGTATGPYRLFQPLSQRYYLVVASLVCRRVGLPDHAIQPAKGERTTFVVRRLAGGGEQAWVPGPPATPGDPPAGSWQTAPAGQLFPGEEQLPMHPTPVAAFAATGTTAAAFGMSEPGRRTVCYGYVATGRRERMVTALTDSAAVAALQAIDPGRQNDPLMSALWTRVISPWGTLLGHPPATAKPPAGSDTDYSSLYILLDLGDWLNTYLPAIYQALTGGTTLANGTAAEDLRKALAGLSVGTRPAPPEQPPPAGWKPEPPVYVLLSQALKDLAGFTALLTGSGTTTPANSYDLTALAIAPQPAWFGREQTAGSLAGLALQALIEANVPPAVPAELSGMIRTDPAAPASGYTPDTYVIRAVFEHYPCAPVLSAQSRPFQLARAIDGDAPARKIRIALPDTSNLRQYKRGVAIEMPPNLRRTLDRVTPALLQGQGLGQDPGPELGMICSFSIQVMWVLSFIVMFLFAISFNIIFWWLAFIKICFPVPVPAPGKDGPPSP